MKKLMLLAAVAATCAADAQETAVTARNNTEILTLPGGTVVTVENNTRVQVVEVPRRQQVKQVRRTAIFIRNDTGLDILDEKAVNFIRNQVKAQASKGDFEIIDFNEAVAAARPMPDALQSAEGVAQMRRYLTLQADLNNLQGNTGQANLGGQGTTSDQRLLAQSSIVRLAQNLEADYILLLTLDGFEAEDFQHDDDPKKWWHKYTLDASYVIMDYSGYTIGGESIVDARGNPVTLRYQKTARITDKSYPNDLSREMAKLLAADMKKNARFWRESSLEKSMVPVSFDAVAMTMDNQPMYIQFDMSLADVEPNVVANNAQVPVRVAALVDVDGVTVGTTDLTVPLAPGMHKVRFWRQGMDDVNMTINAKDGLKVLAPMRVTEGEMLRIQALQQEIHRMTLQKESNQSIADMVRGKAEMFRKSHIRVDATNLPDTYGLFLDTPVLPKSNTNIQMLNNTNPAPAPAANNVLLLNAAAPAPAAEDKAVAANAAAGEPEVVNVKAEVETDDGEKTVRINFSASGQLKPQTPAQGLLFFAAAILPKPSKSAE